MPTTVRDVMTTDLKTVQASGPVRDAARMMADNDIGTVLVLKDDGSLCGIVTDRDITVRSAAGGADPNTQPVDEVCSHSVTSVDVDDSAADAAKTMSDKALRRVPVLSDGHLVGIVSLGDLAIEMDRRSVLGDISAAAPNN
jgi:CBS domain-containing protein